MERKKKQKDIWRNPKESSLFAAAFDNALPKPGDNYKPVNPSFHAPRRSISITSEATKVYNQIINLICAFDLTKFIILIFKISFPLELSNQA